MKVPLSVRNIEIDNETYLEVWQDGKCHLVPRPINPYFYSLTERRDLPHIATSKETVRFISDLKEHEVFKYEFPSVRLVPLFRDNNSLEADIPFVQRCGIDDEGFYLQFPQEKLKILYADIETDSTGIFPRPEKNPIISIAYAIDDKEPECLMIDNLEQGDRQLLMDFIDVIYREDPDVIVGYNFEQFDLPYIIGRCIFNGLATAGINRNLKEAFFVSQAGQRIINLQGRVIFDVYNEVMNDQTLFGITSRSLKDVAVWFDIEKRLQKKYPDYKILKENLGNTRDLIGTEKLKKYNISDVLLTRELSSHYFPNILQIADILQIPLNMITKRTTNLIGTIVCARELKKLNIISDSPNYMRHPKIFGTLNPITNLFEGGTRFEGAIVKLFKKGIFDKPYKIDFTGMYPNIIITFNLSPETTKIIGYEPYGSFRFVRDKNNLKFWIPDRRIGKNVVINIDISNEGFLPKSLLSFRNERAKIKKLIKIQGDNPALISQSWCYKVLANAMYGINGASFFRYGDVAVGILTTALGRHFMQFIIGLNEEHCIESDTDGLFVDCIPAIGSINQKLEEYVAENFRLKNYLEVEEESFQKGYFMKMKNYILLKDDRLITHGVSFKASSKSKVFSRALNILALTMLKSPDKLMNEVNKCLDFGDFEIGDFAMRSKINIPIDDYKNENCLQKQIARQVELHLQQPIQVGDQVEYVKEQSGYKIRNIADIKKIDKKYYISQVKDVLLRLGLDKELWKIENKGQKLLKEY